MASLFSPCSAHSQERIMGNKLFHARLQRLYKQRLRLARATLRTQLETLQHDLRALYLHEVRQGVEDLLVQNSEKFVNSTTIASTPIVSCAESSDINYSSSGPSLENAMKSSERIIQFTNKVAAYSSANLMRILDFSAVLVHHSKKTNTLDLYKISSVSDDAKLRATHSGREDPSAVSGSSVDKTAIIDSRKLKYSTDNGECVFESSPSLPASEMVIANVFSEINHDTKCSSQISHLVKTSNEITTAFYAREFDSLYFSDSRSVLLFDVSQTEQRRLVCVFVQGIDVNSNFKSSRNSRSDIETNWNPFSSSTLVNLTQVEQGRALCGSQAQIAFCEKDRLFVSTSSVGNSMTGVIHVPPVREQTICGDSSSVLTNEKPYFMNFGQFNFGISFFDRHRGHATYAPNMRVPQRKLQTVRSNILTLGTKSEHDFFVMNSHRIQPVKRIGGNESSQNVYPSKQSTTRTDIDSQSSGPFLATSSFHPPPLAKTGTTYFKVTSSPLSFVVPRMFGDDGNDESVLEIDQDGRAQLESLQ